jgi:hypothetical protein
MHRYAIALYPRRCTSSASTTASHPAAVTNAHQRRWFLPEEKHQLDEYYCITQQQ